MVNMVQFQSAYTAAAKLVSTVDQMLQSLIDNGINRRKEEPMRISAKIMADNIKANLAKQSAQLMNTQLKLASGKRINRPSDDHIGIGKVLGYRSTLSTNSINIRKTSSIRRPV